MQFSVLQAAVYTALSETSTNSKFSTTDIKSWINEGYKNVCRSHNFLPLFTSAVKVCVATTVLSSSTGTTLNVTSASNMYAGQKLVVSDGTVYEEVTVSIVNGTIITLVSPGLTGTYISGNYVYGKSIQLPTDLHRINSIIFELIEDGTQEVTMSTRSQDREERNIYPRPGSVGVPANYKKINGNLIYYPPSDDTYSVYIEYFKTPTDLSSDTDTPEFNSAHHDLLIDYACMKAYEIDGKLDKANYFKQNYLLKRSDLIKDDVDEISDTLVRFRLETDKNLPTFSWW